MNPREVLPLAPVADAGAKLKQIQLLILQPTPFCNLQCSYCYLPDRDSRQRMSMETLERALRNVFASTCIGNELTIVWHAGEPMVLPVAYYRKALACIESLKPRGLSIDHSMQSNGSMLSEEWCDFIESRNIRIGLSIDGPEWLHDRHRKTRTGKGSQWLAMRGLRNLQSRGVPFHVITVLTQESLDHPKALFEFYRDHGIHDVGFNIEEIEGDRARSSLDFEGVEARFRQFVETFLGLIEAHPNVISVREFDDLVTCLLAPPGTEVANPQVEPGALLTVDWQGRASTFSPELLGTRHPDYGDFLYADLAARHVPGTASSGVNPIDLITSGAGFQRVHNDILVGIESCRRECAYFSLCGGGAPANKLFERGTFACTETLYCRLTRKVIVDEVLGAVERGLHAGHGKA